MPASAALLCALAALQPESESPRLKYLGRHQNADGSWGRRPGYCECPDLRPSAPGGDPGALVTLLGDDDPRRRDAAEASLRTLGEAALVSIQSGLADPDAEVRGRCERLCGAMWRRFRGVGDGETTALAVLVYLGAGYSTLSRDSSDGISVGDTVTRGLRWLIARQEGKGPIESEDVVAALALCEAHTLTGIDFLEEPARRALESVLRGTPKTERELAWTALVLVSARSALLGYDLFPKAGEVSRALEAFGSTRGAAARTILRKTFSLSQDVSLPTPEVGGLDPETRLFLAIALLEVEGPQSWRWQAWSPGLREGVVSTMNLRTVTCERGSWEGEGLRGRLRATALSQLSLQVFYRYELRLAGPR